MKYVDLREDVIDVTQPAAISLSQGVMPPNTAGVGTKARQMVLNRFAPQR